MRNLTIKKEATIIFNKELYFKEAIDSTIEAFSKIAEATVVEDGRFVVSIRSTGDIDLIAMEFQNYVLGVMKNDAMV